MCLKKKKFHYQSIRIVIHKSNAGSTNISRSCHLRTFQHFSMSSCSSHHEFPFYEIKHRKRICYTSSTSFIRILLNGKCIEQFLLCLQLHSKYNFIFQMCMLLLLLLSKIWCGIGSCVNLSFFFSFCCCCLLLL